MFSCNVLFVAIVESKGKRLQKTWLFFKVVKCVLTCGNKQTDKQLTGITQVAGHPGIHYKTVRQVSKHDTCQRIHRPVDHGHYGPKNDQHDVPAICKPKLLSHERIWGDKRTNLYFVCYRWQINNRSVHLYCIGMFYSSTFVNHKWLSGFCHMIFLLVTMKYNLNLQKMSSCTFMYFFCL